MAKQFFYIAAGVFLLVAAYQLGAERARAEWDPSRPGQIVGLKMEDAFDGSGQAWRITPGGWVRLPSLDLPMPVNDVKFLSAGNALVTNDDVGWWYDGSGWVAIGAFPSPVAIERQSFAQTKARFR